MWFFTPKKKSVDDTAIKSLMSVSSQRNLKNFLEAKKNTFDFIKPLAIIFFTINAGVMAALFEHIDKYGYIIFILGLGLFISMLFVICSISLIRKSILYIDIDNNKFMNIRKKSILRLQYSVYFNLLSFEMSLALWTIENVNYVTSAISKIFNMIISIKNIPTIITM